jgi:hypothetical protein
LVCLASPASEKRRFARLKPGFSPVLAENGSLKMENEERRNLKILGVSPG